MPSDSTPKTTSNNKDLVTSRDGVTRTKSELQAILMQALDSATGPHMDPIVVPEVFATREHFRGLYMAAKDQDVKNDILWHTQATVSKAIFHVLAKKRVSQPLDVRVHV